MTSPESIKANKKLKNKAISVPGTKPSLQNSQLLTSSGIPSLDGIIGGGVAVGTVILVEEDTYGNFGKLMLKYFLAEGVVNRHSLFLASQDTNVRKLVTELPAVISKDSDTNSNKDDKKMTIAWRYQHLPTEEQSNQEFGHNYDLTKTMNQSELDQTEIKFWDVQEEIDTEYSETFANPAYHDLLQSIGNYIKKGEFEVTAMPERRTLLRVGIHALGSPLWLADRKASKALNRDRDLDMFLFCLRALMRSAYAVCMITVPSNMIREDSIARCIHSADMAVKLESFTGTKHETNKSLSEYSGFFKVTKLSAINTLAAVTPETLDLAFKLKRKKFVIEKLHLPPELQDSSQREQDESPSFSCASNKNKLLDF